MLLRFFRTLGDLLTGGLHDRVAGLETRLDDLRKHSNQVEAKIDHLITVASLSAQASHVEGRFNHLLSLAGAQSYAVENGFERVRLHIDQVDYRLRELDPRVKDLDLQLRELRLKIEDLTGRAQDLAESDSALLQSAIHIVESIGSKQKSSS
jgi:hypothetical protein